MSDAKRRLSGGQPDPPAKRLAPSSTIDTTRTELAQLYTAYDSLYKAGGTGRDTDYVILLKAAQASPPARRLAAQILPNYVRHYPNHLRDAADALMSLAAVNLAGDSLGAGTQRDAAKGLMQVLRAARSVGDQELISDLVKYAFRQLGPDSASNGWIDVSNQSTTPLDTLSMVPEESMEERTSAAKSSLWTFLRFSFAAVPILALKTCMQQMQAGGASDPSAAAHTTTLVDYLQNHLLAPLIPQQAAQSTQSLTDVHHDQEMINELLEALHVEDVLDDLVWSSLSLQAEHENTDDSNTSLNGSTMGAVLDGIAARCAGSEGHKASVVLAQVVLRRLTEEEAGGLASHIRSCSKGASSELKRVLNHLLTCLPYSSLTTAAASPSDRDRRRESKRGRRSPPPVFDNRGLGGGGADSTQSARNRDRDRDRDRDRGVDRRKERDREADLDAGSKRGGLKGPEVSIAYTLPVAAAAGGRGGGGGDKAQAQQQQQRTSHRRVTPPITAARFSSEPEEGEMQLDEGEIPLDFDNDAHRRQQPTQQTSSMDISVDVAVQPTTTPTTAVGIGGKDRGSLFPAAGGAICLAAAVLRFSDLLRGMGDQEVERECGRYGRVRTGHVQYNKEEGAVYIGFNSLRDASKAYEGISNDPFFSSISITFCTSDLGPPNTNTNTSSQPNFPTPVLPTHVWISHTAGSADEADLARRLRRGGAPPQELTLRIGGREGGVLLSFETHGDAVSTMRALEENGPGPDVDLTPQPPLSPPPPPQPAGTTTAVVGGGSGKEFKEQGGLPDQGDGGVPRRFRSFHEMPSPGGGGSFREREREGRGRDRNRDSMRPGRSPPPFGQHPSDRDRGRESSPDYRDYNLSRDGEGPPRERDRLDRGGSMRSRDPNINNTNNPRDGGVPEFATLSLWVGQVPGGRNAEEDFLDAFSRFGKLANHRFMRKTQCAFVDFVNIRDATEARYGMDGSVLAGSTLRVQFKDENRFWQRQGRGGPPPPGRDLRDLRDPRDSRDGYGRDYPSDFPPSRYREGRGGSPGGRGPPWGGGPPPPGRGWDRSRSRSRERGPDRGRDRDRDRERSPGGGYSRGGSWRGEIGGRSPPPPGMYPGSRDGSQSFAREREGFERDHPPPSSFNNNTTAKGPGGGPHGSFGGSPPGDSGGGITWRGTLAKNKAPQGSIVCIDGADPNNVNPAWAAQEPRGWPDTLDVAQRTDLQFLCGSLYPNLSPGDRAVRRIIAAPQDAAAGPAFSAFIAYLRGKNRAGVVSLPAVPAVGMPDRKLYLIPPTVEVCRQLGVGWPPLGQQECLLALIMPASAK